MASRHTATTAALCSSSFVRRSASVRSKGRQYCASRIVALDHRCLVSIELGLGIEPTPIAARTSGRLPCLLWVVTWRGYRSSQGSARLVRSERHGGSLIRGRKAVRATDRRRRPAERPPACPAPSARPPTPEGTPTRPETSAWFFGGRHELTQQTNWTLKCHLRQALPQP